MLQTFFGLVLLSALATSGMRFWSLRKGLLDHPNLRSSHQLPTPRGGGLAIIVVFTGYVFASASSLPMGLENEFRAVTLAGLMMAVLGFWDDLQNLSAKFRLGCQILIVGALVAAVGDIWLYSYFPSVPIAQVVLVIALVWWVNLFNFLDGIDGYAASEAVFIIGSAILLSLVEQGTLPFLSWGLGLMASIVGFLLLNWPPAKIFMGDVGSCALGLLIGGLFLVALKAQWIPVWSLLIITALFWIDATLTLVRRVSTGQKWYEAHRSHAYQILSRFWGSHKKVTLSLWVVNAFWLLPLAISASIYSSMAAVFFLVAITPLVLGVYKLDSGLNNG